MFFPLSIFRRRIVASDPLLNGLVGWWKFDDGSGLTAIDSSNFGNHLDLESGATWVTGQVNGAIHLDGSGDGWVSCEMTESLNLTGAMTVVGWLNMNNYCSAGGLSIIANAYRDPDGATPYTPGVGPDGEFMLTWSDDGPGELGQDLIRTDLGVIELDTWIHTAAVRHANLAVELYVNGVSMPTTLAMGTGTLEPADSADLFEIGTVAGGTVELYRSDMSLDDLRLYNRALSAEEIITLFGGNTLLEGLIGWWKFDEGTGGTASDSSGNDYDGTISGATWTTGRLGTDVALSFDGTNDSVLTSATSGLALTGALTTTAWILPNTIPATPGDGDSIVIYYNSSGFSPYNMMLSESNKAGISWSNDVGTPETWLTTDSAITTGVWQHLAVVRLANGNVLTYVDGVLRTIGSSGDVTPSTVTDGWVEIGGLSSFSVFYYDGKMQDVRIYNRALTPAEINLLVE